MSGALIRWGFDDRHSIALAVLIVTELVANALRHAGGVAKLVVSADADAITLAVTDRSSGVPALREPDQTGGRGLMVIEALAMAWGHTAEPGGGKTVWARLRTHHRPTPAT